MHFYNAGLDALAPWTTVTYKWVLLSAGTFDATDATITAVLAGATEVSVSGYARAAVTTKVRTVADQISYTADEPSWAGLGGGQNVVAVVLIRDSDSVPIGWWDVSPAVATDSATPLVFTLTDGLVAYVEAA